MALNLLKASQFFTAGRTRGARFVGELGVGCRYHVAAVIPTALVVAQLRSEHFGDGRVFCEIAVPLQFTSLRRGFGGGERRGG